MQHKIQLALADDHAVLRAGLRMLLSAQPDMEVVGEAEDGNETLEIVASTKPDVLIFDLSMPETHAAQVIRKIRKGFPKIRILVLTMHAEPEYLNAAFQAGVSGYVLKRALHSDLLFAIRAVHAGEIFVDPRMSKFMVERALGSSSQDAPSQKAIEVLTPRETEVLRLAARGFSNRQTADRLHISEKSVEKYRSQLLRKLNLRDRAEMVEFALRAGILSASS